MDNLHLLNTNIREIHNRYPNQISYVSDLHLTHTPPYFEFGLLYRTITQQEACIDIIVTSNARDIICKTTPIFDISSLTADERASFTQLLQSRFIKDMVMDKLQSYSPITNHLVYLCFVIPETAQPVVLANRLIRSFRKSLGNLPIGDPRAFIKHSQ